MRGHLAEHGVAAPQGPTHLKTLAAAIADLGLSLPALVRDIGSLYLEPIEQLSRKSTDLEKVLRSEAQRGVETRRLQTMPGIGPITAMAVEAFAPPMETFKRGRDFAAWLGLVPVQHSTRGKQRLGRTSKMGQRDIRRLLTIGAMAVIQWASRCASGILVAQNDRTKAPHGGRDGAGEQDGPLDLAMLTKSEDYRDPVGAA